MNLNPFINLIVTILNVYGWILIIWIILSILISFDIINRYNPVVSKISHALYKLTEPVLGKIRKYMPDFGVIDISPIIVFLAIRLITDMLYTYLYTY